MATVMVLGDSGFIGSAVVRALEQRGVLVVRGHAPDTGSRVVDVTSPEAIRESLIAHRVDCLVNLVGSGMGANVQTADRMYVSNQVAAVAAARAVTNTATDCKLIHVSSGLVNWGRDGVVRSPYCMTKADGLRQVRATLSGWENRLEIVNLQSVYGPGQPGDRFVATCIRAERSGAPLQLTNPDETRDFVYIDDVASCLADRAMSGPSWGVPIEIGTGDHYSIEHAAKMVRVAVRMEQQGLLPDACRPYWVTPVTHSRGTGESWISLWDGLVRTLLGTQELG